TSVEFQMQKRSRPAGAGRSSLQESAEEPLLLRFQRRLGGGEAGDGDALRRTADVVEADARAELHARRLAAMLAADADLQVRTLRPALRGAHLHQFADAFLIDRLERIAGDDVRLLRIGVRADERPVVVAADAQRGLRQVVGAEAEEL